MRISANICAIYNEASGLRSPIGYVLYYSKWECFSIELADGLSIEDAPLFFHAFLKRKIYTLDSYWSRKWVDQRIVPEERQNLGAILKEAGLKSYQPYRLLLWGKGRSSQDDCYIVLVDENRAELPKWFVNRMEEKAVYSMPLSGRRMVIAFGDGMLRVITMNGMERDVWLLPDGNGLTSEKGVIYTNQKLRKMGTILPISMDDLKEIIAMEVVTSKEAQEILHCSRQNLNYYTDKGVFTNILTDTSHRLYWRHELER